MASSPEAQQLLERWRLEKEPSAQKELLDQLFTNGIFPNNTSVPTWDEYDTFTNTENDGLYPDMNSDTFLEKLMKKQEFHESKQHPISEKYAMKKDTCRSTEEFEISPVQRFIARFLSPTTPYNSALLYHGVGVGKTCAAITVCESYLELNPNKKAIIIAPPNIQEGFKRTIFDIEALEIGVGDSPNRHRGCTQNIYLH
jgi:chromosomal replication initiation ATPase DnaA